MNQSKPCVPDWLVERLAHGDLDERRAAEVRARLAAEPDGDARLRAIEASNIEVLQRYPAADVAASISRRMHVARVAAAAAPARRSALRRSFVTMPLAAGAVAAVLVLARPAVTPQPQVVQETTRMKGGVKPNLKLYRQRDGKVQQLRDGTAAHARDVLQLAYVAGGKRHGAVLSIDGTGRITWHLPELPGVAELKGGGEVNLAHAYELDDAPGFERFLFVTSDRPFSPDSALEILRSGVPVSGIEAHTLTLKKEQQP